MANLHPRRLLFGLLAAVMAALLAWASTSTASNQPCSGGGGLRGVMNCLFYSTSTDAEAFQTQRLMGVYGGSLVLRPVSQGINIVNFSAPRIDAGCGGIDIFFGSFSFINGEQFEQLIRSIASAAIGYAIKAAIAAMCDTCAAILEDLEEAIRLLNSLAKNTCATAQALLSGELPSKLAETARKIGTNLASAAQRTADWLSGENRSQAQKPSETASGQGSSGSGSSGSLSDENPIVGNLVYRAAKSTFSNGANTLSLFLREKDAIEMTMGLFGTTIVLPEAMSDGAVNENNRQQQQCPQGVPSERCDYPAQYYGPTIGSLDMLFYPKRHVETGLPVWQCAGRACRGDNLDCNCTRLTTGQLSLDRWPGIEAVINKAIFGCEQFEGCTFPQGSLVGSILNGGGELSAEAQRFVRADPTSLYRQLLEVQHNKGAVVLIAHHASKYLPDFFAYQMGIEFINIANNTFSEQTKVSPPENFKREVERKAAELSRMRPRYDKLLEIFNQTAEGVAAVQRLTTSPVTFGGE